MEKRKAYGLVGHFLPQDRDILGFDGLLEEFRQVLDGLFKIPELNLFRRGATGYIGVANL